MDFSGAIEKFERLEQEQEHHLSTCNSRLEKWHKFREDYDVLKEKLSCLPDELKYDIMVPISKKGFMLGKLVHTNEILVLLGDNWLVERSTKQATQIIDRRINGIDEHIQKLNKEKEGWLDAIKWTQNITKEKKDFVNIEERIEEKIEAPESKRTEQKINKELSEDEKRHIRQKQQERALAFQRKINEELKIADKSTDEDEEEDESTNVEMTRTNVNTEECQPDEFMNEFCKAIETLDIEQQFGDDGKIKYTDLKKVTELKVEPQPGRGITPGTFNFDDMLKEYEKTVDRENNKTVQNSLKKASGKVGKKQVNWSDINETLNKEVELDEVESYSEYSSDNDSDEDVDESETDTTRTHTNVIHFKHTSNSNIDELMHNQRVSRDKSSLDNPGDIYKSFYQPKSILKSRSCNQTEISSNFINGDSVSVQKESKSSNLPMFEPEKAFTGEIVEKNLVTKQPVTHEQMNENVPKKKLSKFQASRLKN